MHRITMWGLAVALIACPALADYPEASEALGDEYRFQRGLFQTWSGEQELYLGIGDDMLDTPFLIATTVTSGGSVTGFQWADYLVCWEKIGDQIALVEKNTRYVGKGVLEDAVSRAYTDRVLFALPIVAQHSETGSYLIDGMMLFAGNSDVLFGPGFYFDRSLAKLDLKSFRDNLEISYTMPSAMDGSLNTLHYSLSRLPNSDYTPRHADPRVGYFLTVLKDFSNGSYEDGQFVRLINRWNVQKLDPSLEMSPPAEPIIFYVEKTVPVRFRKAVHDGILEWNKAFEKIGIVGAVEVRQQTEYNEFSELDPEDVNYNFFRWITSGSAFAMGPSRVHPLTGEILDADIVFDDAMANSYEQEGAFYFGDDAMAPQWREFLDSFGTDHVINRFRAPESPLMIGGQVVEPHHDHLCALGHGRTHQLGMARIALGDVAMQASFIDAIVKDTVMHEVGHTLGLRHNFKASTWHTLEEINSEDAPGAIAGSVMDYLPINIGGETQGNYAMDTIGPYDYWAIEYGYKPVEDPSELAEVLKRVAEDGLIYGTDEDVGTPDPRAVRWDLGADMVDYAESRMALAKSLWAEVVGRVEDGESYTTATRAFNRLFFEYWYSAQLVGQYVGGSYLYRDFKGDPDGRLPVTPVDAAQQKKALALVARVLKGEDFDFSPELLRSLAAGRWSHWGSADTFADTTFPIRDMVLTAQLRAFSSVMNPWTFDELLGQSYLVEGDAVTCESVIETLVDAVFVTGGKAAVLSDMQRNLQRNIAEPLISIVLAGPNTFYPPEVTACLRYELKDVLKQLPTDSKDAATRIHALDIAERIESALAASMQRN